MNQVAENLDRYYQSFANCTDHISFFTGLADYINYILEEPQLKEITDPVIASKNLEAEKLASLEEDALGELREIKTKLLKVIKDRNILATSLLTARSHFAGSSDLLEALDAFESGRLRISGFRSDNLENFLFDIASSIAKLGYSDDIKVIVGSGKDQIFSRTLQLRRDQTALIRIKEKVEFWGALDALLTFQKAFVTIKNNKHFGDIFREYGALARNHQESIGVVNLAFAAEDFEKIISTRNRGIQDRELEFLKLSDFKRWANKTHPFLLAELSKQGQGDKEKIGRGAPLVFDSEESTLAFWGTVIKIAKSKDSNAHYLLKAVFKKPQKLWSYDELADEMGDGYARNKWRRFYNAAYSVNVKIAKQTTINDFLSITAKTVQINAKYLT